MKFFLLIALLIASYPAFTDDKKGAKEPDFEKIKEKILKHMDMRISHMQENRACVSAAKGPDDLRVCREKMKAKSGAMKDEMKEEKEAMKAQKKEGKGQRKGKGPTG